MRVEMMNHHKQECYSRKGIPEAVLLYAAKTLQKPIKSSPGYSPDGQWRIPAATKVWQRLCQAGHATYDSDADTFNTVV